jgi:hypothetical protein
MRPIAMHSALPRLAACLVLTLPLAACMGSGPVAMQEPAPAVPVPAVTQSALAPPAQTSLSPPVSTRSPVPSVAMATAPGARESAGLSNVSRSSTGAASSGPALGGTLVSGQSAGVIPTVVDRNREPPRYRNTAPQDTRGPGTAPPIVAPELRDTTGNSLRNRQRVEF